MSLRIVVYRLSYDDLGNTGRGSSLSDPDGPSLTTQEDEGTPDLRYLQDLVTVDTGVLQVDRIHLQICSQWLNIRVL